jgi:hypothetical protein
MLQNVSQGLGLGEFFVTNKYRVRMRSEVMWFRMIQRQAVVNTSM